MASIKSSLELSIAQSLLFIALPKSAMKPAQNQSITTVKRPFLETSQHHTGEHGNRDAQSVLRLHERLGSWEAVADVLGYSPAFWWKVAHGKIKKPVSEELRRCLVSSDPKFLRLIQQGAVPYLRKRGETS